LGEDSDTSGTGVMDERREAGKVRRKELRTES
jgi:hypothetical protein